MATESTDGVRLRDVIEEDLPILFDHQRDPVANQMAAFPARDRDAFMEHWATDVLGDDTARKQTILFEDQVVGNILSFEMAGRTLVGYWIGRDRDRGAHPPTRLTATGSGPAGSL
jgi:RimJ/RimL family protein N-acetyltransferase